MKIRKVLAAWITAAIIGGIAGFTALPAVAATSYSSYLTFGGSSYQGRSVLNSTSKKAFAQTNSLIGTVPTGWLGAQGRLYVQSSGALCTQAGWVYSGSPLLGFTSGGTSGYCGAGAYQSFSVSRGWDAFSSSYWTNYNNISPALNF